MKQKMTMIPALLVIAVAFGAYAWQPTGGLDELYDDALLPRLRPGVQAASFSSYDRTGGNNDGFSGAYSKLREENGNSVIAEMEGPGCIYRLWMTHSSGDEDGLLERKGEHIKVYLDGSDTPALDVPVEDLFNDSLERFPAPISGQGIGGYYTYIPIPYRKSCKVVLEGLGVRFYQLNYVTFPSDEGIENFTMEMSESDAAALGKAVERWRNPLGTLQQKTDAAVEVPVAHHPAGRDFELFSHTLTSAAAMFVHGMTLTGLTAEEVERSQIEITFSDPHAHSIRLPLDLFFGHAFQADPFTSLLFGRENDTYYNRVPFVYQGECVIRLHSILPLEGTLVVYQSPLDAPMADFGALAVQYHEGMPTVPEVYHPLLRASGAGHVVGTYLVTEGPKGLPYWLEGDDRWTIDGELRIHGTGSEDYFNCGWYALPGRLNGPAALPSHGFPIYGETDNTMRATAFRWHFSDPVPFDREIEFEIEHGEVNRHIAEYRSVTFWYAGRP